MKSHKWRMGAILLAVVVLAGVVTGVAFANSGQPNRPDVGQMYQSFVTKFAANLGVDESQVTAALDATKKQMLDEAVQQGKITQEQADKIAASKDLGFGGLGFRYGKEHFKGDGLKGPGRNLEGMAKALGMTVEELKAELDSGKKMEQVLADHGMTLEQLHQKVLENKKDTIAKAVAEGKVTQDQANKILEKMEQRFNRQIPGEDQ